MGKLRSISHCPCSFLRLKWKINIRSCVRIEEKQNAQQWSHHHNYIHVFVKASKWEKKTLHLLPLLIIVSSFAVASYSSFQFFSTSIPLLCSLFFFCLSNCAFHWFSYVYNYHVCVCVQSVYVIVWKVQTLINTHVCDGWWCQWM